MSHIVTGPLVRRLAQDSRRGAGADVCCAALRPSHPPRSACESVMPACLLIRHRHVAENPEPEAAEAGAARAGGADRAPTSPDRTPTNETPSLPSPCAYSRVKQAGEKSQSSPPMDTRNLREVTNALIASREYADPRGVGGVAGGARRGSASSASTPSTLERTAIHNPQHTVSHQGSADSAPESILESNCPPYQESGVEPEPEPVPELEQPQPTEPAPAPPEERLSPRTEMRLALDQGTDMLADQEAPWGGGSDRWSWRAACPRALLRRVSSADAVALARPSPPPHSARRTAPRTTLHSSVYAWKAPENDKLMEMEQLARVEAQTMRSRTRSQCPNGKMYEKPCITTYSRALDPTGTWFGNPSFDRQRTCVIVWRALYGADLLGLLILCRAYAPT
ncbi:hypothetical protein EVAR_78803_1 [Eumeta japonica]|uniref:Uncharacterized protein n=1 Tax=Eumeta variegata TaxID=151549 RepID=A0A4C1T1N7_EUMVA|nr:hypothetical protein EVAR_78803_1 [Eumeta japonica]